MNIFDPDIIDTFKDTLLNAKNIAVVGHKNIDADCLGSALAISLFFEKKGVNTDIIIPNELPVYFDWIEDIKKVTIYDNAPWDAVDKLSFADAIFYVDWNDLKRTGNIGDVLENSNALKIMIDHHREPTEIADFSFVDSSRSSAAELVYEFLKIIDLSNIDKKIAEYLYMGIVSDTGSFKYDSANAHTFRIAAELLDYEIDKSKVINGLFNNFSFDRLRLMGFALSERTVYLPEKQVAYMYITKEDKKKFNFKPGDHENFVNWPLAIKGVKMSALFTENNDEVKISLRSIGDFDVNKVARKFFNGGGHINAAGGSSNLSIEETIKIFSENVDEFIAVATNNDK